MAATDPQILMSEGSCYACFGPVTIGQLMKLTILANTLTNLNSMAATDPQSLFAYGKCFACYGLSAYDIMELALLDQISQGISGGGGGGGAVTCGNYGGAQPSYTPATACDVAIDTSDGTIYWYYSGAWHP